MKFATVIGAVVLISMLVSASFSQTPKPTVRPQAAAASQNPAGGDLPLNLSGAFSGIRTVKQVVVRDAAAFAELWKQHLSQGSAAPTPQVDFKKYDVIAVFAGAKNTGGHSIAIESVDIKGKTATVHVKMHKPGLGTMVPQAFTYPFAMKAVPKLPKTVKFEISEAAAGPP